MVSLTALAAAIENGGTYTEPRRQTREQATADAIRAAGVPDILNRFLPENAHLNIRKVEPMKAPGPKEAQVRALRTTTAPAPKASAKAQPEAAQAVVAPEPAAPAPAQSTKESKTMRKTSSTTKAKARTGVKAKAATTGKKPTGEKPATKLDLIASLLKRKEGCTTADVLKATEWPAVSMPQQAKAAGLKLKKVKEGRVTRYFAA